MTGTAGNRFAPKRSRLLPTALVPARVFSPARPVPYVGSLAIDRRQFAGSAVTSPRGTKASGNLLTDRSPFSEKGTRVDVRSAGANDELIGSSGLRLLVDNRTDFVLMHR